jgi:AraC-like DNA-binding protein
MPLVPLPFVVALLLVILLVAVLRENEAMRPRPGFSLLIGACILQSILIGLRWGYGNETLRFLLPLIAAAVPPLVYASFAGLAGRGSRLSWLHALPTILVGTLLLAWPAAIDAALVAIFVLYALILAILSRTGPDGLVGARLGRAASAGHAVRWAAAALGLSACIDAVVAMDLAWAGGWHAAGIITVANLGNLLVLGLAARTGSQAEPGEESSPAASDIPGPAPASGTPGEDQDVIDAIGTLMRERKLFSDPDLSLNRLARKLGRPAREVSQAVNRAAGQNVSQFINRFRIAEACRLLAETDRSVTEIMFDAGFLTKSNFNREFRRVTGTSPSAWRMAAVPGRTDTPLSKSAAIR